MVWIMSACSAWHLLTQQAFSLLLWLSLVVAGIVLTASRQYASYLPVEYVYGFGSRVSGVMLSGGSLSTQGSAVDVRVEWTGTAGFWVHPATLQLYIIYSGRLAANGGCFELPRCVLRCVC